MIRNDGKEIKGLIFDIRFNVEGQLVGQAWLLHDACLVASVLGDSTK
jgi:hypothetical protein